MSKAVLFDCDGVVIDSMPVHAAAWVALFQRYGIEIEPVDVYLEEGRSIVDFCQRILNRNGYGDLKLSAFDLSHEKERSVIAQKKIKLFPDIPVILQEIQQSGRQLGMVTGSNQMLIQHVIPQSVRKQFDVIVTADDVQHGKPAPDPYLCAAEKLALDPSDCQVVENAPMGIRAAKAAGMQVVAITTTLDAGHLQQADSVVENFQELRNILKSKPFVV